jgi:CubicO group peptidase (beta-lactamase class C family)
MAYRQSSYLLSRAVRRLSKECLAQGGIVLLNWLAVAAIWTAAMNFSLAQAAVQSTTSPVSLHVAVKGSVPTVAPAGSSNALSAADVNAWLDGLVPYAIQHSGVAGAVIVVVKDDKVLFEKGYGYADVDARRPIDPETTLFRLASISKLFTWTAVMQQVELGKLNLDTDINTYLDFHIADTWPRRITLRNLMTHTSGFEETNKNTYAPEARSMPPLGDLLKAWVPERMYPPGQVVAYSNYGAALAGYIVERVSHERFEDYVAHHILVPLGMRHATFLQPLPVALAADISNGYLSGSDSSSPFEFVELRPAGGLSASASDMARFMIAHLEDGAFGGNRILKPETVMLMHGEAFQADPALPGMGLGFWHLDRGGHVIVAHTGDTVLFHSGLYLVLDAHTGLFVSQNSEDNRLELPRVLFQAFMDRYFPSPPPAPTPTLKTALADGLAIAGTYENSRRADSNFMITEEVFNERTISVNRDATISLSGSNEPNGETRRWQEVAPFRWRELHGDHMLDAKLQNGRIGAIMTDASAPISVLMPTSFWRSANWNVPLFIATLAVLAASVLFWPIKAALRWRYAIRFPHTGRAAIAYRLTRVVAILDLAFLLGWAEFLSYAVQHVDAMDARLDWFLRTLQVIGALGALGVIVPFYAVACALPDRRLPWWTKATDAFLALACLAAVWFAFSLKLLSWSLNY